MLLQGLRRLIPRCVVGKVYAGIWLCIKRLGVREIFRMDWLALGRRTAVTLPLVRRQNHELTM